MGDGRALDQERILRVTSVCGAALALVFALTMAALAEPQMLANFDSAHERWTFSDGPEFPGSSGRLTTGEGLDGRGGRLEYAFACVRPDECGAYVSAELELPSRVVPREGDMLAFAASPAADASLAIRLTDGSGQTLQFPLALTTLERQAPSGWRQLFIALDREAPEHWGGANTGRLNNGLARIAFLARGSAPQHGALLLDDIRIVNVRDQAYALPARFPAAARATPAAAPLLAVNLADRGDLRGVDAAHAAGVKLVRTDLYWDQVERRGAYDFSAYDPLISALAARDMRALLILDYGHPDHGGGGAFSTDADRGAFVAYARAAAAHFRNQPVSFEIWNEPDTGSFRRFAPDLYARLARETAAGVHDVNSGVEIISGGLSWANDDYFDAMLPGLRDAPLSAIAVHPYRPGGPETVAGDLPRLRAAIAADVRGNPPLWVTEWGYSSSFGDDGHADANRRRQGALLARQMLTLWALRAPVAVWYELSDRDNSAREGESNFGLLDTAGRPKPAYAALQTFAALAAQRRLVGILQDLPPLAHALWLEGDHDAVCAIWTEAPGGRLVVTAPQNLISARDAFGAPIAYDAQRRLIVSEAGGPLYLRLSH